MMRKVASREQKGREDDRMKDKIKVMLVSGTLGRGGAQRQSSYLVKLLDEEKFEPVLCLFRKTGSYLEDIPRNTPIYDLGARGRFNTPRLVWRLRKVIQKERPDIVFSMLWRSNLISFLADKAIRGIQPRLVLSIRNDLRAYSKFALLTIKYIYSWADIVVVNSEGVGEEVIENTAIPSSSIRVIPNGVDITYVKALAAAPVRHDWFGKGVPVLISVASLNRKKGYPYLIKAFNLVNKAIPCYLLILGDGPERRSLEKLAFDLGIRKRVAFLGFQSNPFKYMARATLFVLASLWEGLPNVVLEAMSIGTPVVATEVPCGGTAEIIEDGVNGFLVPVADPETLAGKIVELLKRPELRGKFSEEGMKTVGEKFSVENMVREFEQVFLEVVNRR